MPETKENIEATVVKTASKPLKQLRVATVGLTDISNDGKITEFMAASQGIPERTEFAYGAGGYDASTYRLWKNCQYPLYVSFDMYYQMYTRNNVAARVIETYPDYCWKVSPLVTDEGGGNTRFSRAANEALISTYRLQDDVRLSLIASMKQLDILGGIGGESLLVFGFEDGKTLDQPVTYKAGMKVAWIKVLHNGQFKANTYVDDESSPFYGDVATYVTKEFRDSYEPNYRTTIPPGKVIHATRAVLFKETKGLAYGKSRICRCYNQLLDIVKLAGASAEVYWLGAFSGMAIESNSDTEISDAAYEKMKEELERYFNGVKRSLVLDGASAKLMFPSIVSPAEHFDLQLTMISIATEIPRRFLTGAEAAKLASQQDTRNWEERVSQRRANVCDPTIVRPVVDRLIAVGVLPKPKQGTYTVNWASAQVMAFNERANASRNMTESWISYFTSGMNEAIDIKTYLVYACGCTDQEADSIVRNYKEDGVAKMLKIAASSKTSSTSSAKSSDNFDSTNGKNSTASNG